MANHEYRVQRGRILKILYRGYDQALHIGNIALALGDMRLSASSGVLRAHIQYLEERGMVTAEQVKSEYFSGEDLNVKLTWRGVDFVEKDASDDGIELGV